MLTTKITFALADWIREWRKCRDKNPSIDAFIKFVEWKLEDYKLTDSDKRIIEDMFFLFKEVFEDCRIYFKFIYKKQWIIKILLQIKKKVNQHIYGFTENIKRSNL